MLYFIYLKAGERFSDVMLVNLLTKPWYYWSEEVFTCDWVVRSMWSLVREHQLLRVGANAQSER